MEKGSLYKTGADEDYKNDRDKYTPVFFGCGHMYIVIYFNNSGLQLIISVYTHLTCLPPACRQTGQAGLLFLPKRRDANQSKMGISGLIALQGVLRENRVIGEIGVIGVIREIQVSSCASNVK